MEHATQSPFTSYDGQNLALYDWPLGSMRRARAMVLIVHGLGEHAWRYDRLANELNAHGFAVRAYDHRGHGSSGGKRGCLPAADTLLKDLADVIEDTRAAWCRRWKTPLVVLGHSMGGLVSALYVTRHLHQPDFSALGIHAMVLSSPALDAGLNLWQKGLLAVLPGLLPNITLGNGLDASRISHDPEVVSAYLRDPAVHDRISPRLARFIADGGPEVLASAHEWKVPTLLLYAGDDSLVNPEGSRRFAQTAPDWLVTARRFDGYYHELFNEVGRQEVMKELLAWLDMRYATRV